MKELGDHELVLRIGAVTMEVQAPCPSVTATYFSTDGQFVVHITRIADEPRD